MFFGFVWSLEICRVVGLPGWFFWRFGVCVGFWGVFFFVFSLGGCVGLRFWDRFVGVECCWFCGTLTGLYFAVFLVGWRVELVVRFLWLWFFCY